MDTRDRAFRHTTTSEKTKSVSDAQRSPGWIARDAAPKKWASSLSLFIIENCLFSGKNINTLFVDANWNFHWSKPC